MAAYPSIPIDLEGFEELPRDYATLRTEYESGYVQTRARRTTGPRVYRFRHRLATAANVTTFVTFWDARKGGAEAFDFTDPRTAATISVRFRGAMPAIVPRTPSNVAFDIGPIEVEEAL